MKKLISALGLGLVVILLAAGCSKSPSPDSGKLETPAVAPASQAKADSVAFQGAWKGHELGAEDRDPSSLVFSGTNLIFHDADTNEWYKATFTLRENTDPKQLIAVITDCPLSEYVGKTANAIYRLDNGTLTITANEPGDPEMPKRFDDPDNLPVIFKMVK